MLGIGLGGFMDGWNKMADSQRADKRQALADQQAARQQTLNQREDAEYERGLNQRNEIDALNAGAKAEFDKRVAAGTEKPDNFDNFWSGYALPKLKNTYLAQGNLDMANKVQAWGESEDARAGAKLFMGSLAKLQVGDYDGAVNDALAGAKRTGYFAHGFEITGKDTIVEREGGPTIVYRFNFKGPDGKEGRQDVPIGKLGTFIANIGNPKAAWRSQIEAQKETANRAIEREDYLWKKKTDKEFSTEGDKRRSDAIAVLRKRMDGGLGGKEAKFDDLPRDQKEKLIKEEQSLQQGTMPGQTGLDVPTGDAPARAAGSGRKVLVDKATGKPADPAQVSPAQRAAPQADKIPVPQRRPEPEQPSAISRQDNLSYALEEAEQALSDGQRPERIAQSLAQNGIPQEQWPQTLLRALANEKRVGFGLNMR